MMICGVYKITNIVNGKMYIGSSVNIPKRKIFHLYQLRNNIHHNPYLQKSFAKYGEEKFEFTVIEYCEIDDCEKKEQYYLDLYGSATRGVGYNMCRKAGNVTGKKVSDKTKRKISAANKGRKMPEWQVEHLRKINTGLKRSKEVRQASSDRNRGKKMSLESRIKMSNSQKGKLKSDAHKAILREAQKTAKRKFVPVIQYDLDGNFIARFNSVKEAVKVTGINFQNLYKHFNGERRHVNSFVFKRA